MHPQRQRQAPEDFLSATVKSPARGFSLLELLLTLAIILILFVVMYGSGSRSRQSRSAAACQKNLQTIYLALQLYGNDFNGQFPRQAGAASAEEPLSVLIPKYCSVTEPFICPGSPDASLPEGVPFAQRKISYAYYMGRRVTDAPDPLLSDRQLNADAKTRGQPLFSADGKGGGSNHNKYGGNVMFCDGRIEHSPARSAFPLPLGPGIVLLNPKP